MNPNIRAQARCNAAACSNPAHRRAIEEYGEWDGGQLVRDEYQRLAALAQQQGAEA